MTSSQLLRLSLVAVASSLLLSACSPLSNVSSRSGGSASGSAANVSPTDIPNFTAYTNSTHNVRIQYPQKWEKSEGVMGSTVAFASPQESAKDLFKENVNLYVQALPADAKITLDEFTQQSIAQIKQMITDAQMVESTSDTLSNLPAHRVVYTGKQGQFNLKFYQTYLLKDSKVYIMTYTAQADQFDKYLPEARAIIDSLRFQ
jgi:serine/threonine-protein kinase